MTLKSHVEKPPREGSKAPDERHTFKKTSWTTSSAWDEGQAMTFDEAVAFAVEDNAGHGTGA